MTINFFILVGKITARPEIKFSKAGKPYSTLLVECEETFNEQKRLDVFQVPLFGAKAEQICNLNCAGMEVFVEGRLQMREWEYQGKSGWNLELYPRKVVIPNIGEPPEAAAPESQDDLPF